MQNNIKIIPRRVTSAIGGGGSNIGTQDIGGDSGNIGTHDHKLQ